MSWLRSAGSFARQLSRSLDPRHDYEPQACYSSFCKHWQQAHDIILKSQPQHLHDDVLGVVNHLEQLATLLVLEAKARELSSATSPAACLEYLLSENLLDKLYEWAICTGKYENAVRLEQLKLFGSLVSHYSSQVIAAEPFLRPLLKLLSGFRNELPPPNLESQLVTVLNQICVALMQNMKFIDLFFLTTHTQNGSQAEFILVRLLLSSVHREGATGAAARDALLLCAKMSARCPQLAECMLLGNTCVVLATGLSGLYSLLPRTLGERVYRLTPDDVNHVHKLTLFIDSLEFCNAVAQVAHPSIKKQLLDLLYQGFLVPVMGPALLQSGAAEQAAAMAYLELVLRCATPTGLLRAVLHFVLTHEYDNVRVCDVLLARLHGDSQLSLVSLSLMETLIDLNCEDVMIELVFKYLLNGHHLMVTQRHQIADPEPYREAAIAFLGLSPRCCSRPLDKTREWVDEMALSGRRILDFKRDDEHRRVNGVHGDIAMSNLVQEIKFNYGNPNETLFGNYHAYLCDARFEIVSRTIACAAWSAKYDSFMNTPVKKETNNNSTKDTKEIDAHTLVKEQDSLISVCTSGYDTLKTSDTSEKEPLSLTSLNDNVDNENKTCESQDSNGKEHDSLTSIGESSGYDSFRYKTEESDENEAFAEDSFRQSVTKTEQVREYNGEMPLIRSWRASAESIIGPLLSSLLKKAASLLEAELAVNWRVTSALCKLAALPTPLLASLLCPSFVLQPNVPSLFQILSKLKEEVDELTTSLDNIGELVDKARVFLIQREMALAKSRGPISDDGPTHTAEAGQRADESPFKRVEAKRRSLSSSLSNMFGRRLSSSSPSPQAVSIQNSSYTSSPQKRPVFTQEAYWNQSITLRSILNAVLLDEWVKELAALCEEHALRLAADNYEDDTYIRTVAL
ncbi:FHIP family protein GJ17503 isoform X2 [Pectinophora gossypiella]|uniref:FHIP family protein GJ17503 isoform X2 n=1 Tax=Pectinophora gossypiella TaxID=13191 RepID=UPI00214F281D|nr:FHIP family protein GJ17503 isoform X2 [Pectinophora gossypiella]